MTKYHRGSFVSCLIQSAVKVHVFKESHQRKILEEQSLAFEINVSIIFVPFFRITV